MGAVCFEHEEGQSLPDGAIDGMAEMVEQAEADGYEGGHVFDGEVEDPPHPFWNAAARRCYTEEERKALGLDL